TKIPDPGGVAEGVTPPVGAARSIGYGKFRAVARRQRDGFGDSFRGLVVPGGGNPVNQEGEIAVACVGGGKLKANIDSLRDLSRVLQAVIAVEIDQIGPV